MSKQPPRFTRLNAADRRVSLIEASLACMADGGLSNFTVDKVCARAGVSRGLVTHHFGGMAGLLAATYAHLYAEVIPTVASLPPGTSRLMALIDILFDPRYFNRPALNTWLTMWGAISNTPELLDEHRRQYAGYLVMVGEILAERAAQEGKVIDTATLASVFIALVDGLSLQHCIDPPSMPVEMARQACIDFLDQRFATA